MQLYILIIRKLLILHNFQHDLCQFKKTRKLPHGPKL